VQPLLKVGFRAVDHCARDHPLQLARSSVFRKERLAVRNIEAKINLFELYVTNFVLWNHSTTKTTADY
jgi:hypothetical protein